MAVDAATLAEEVGAPISDSKLEQCITVAKHLLDELTESDLAVIPAEVFEEAWLATAAGEFNRRKSPNGMVNQAFSDAGGDNYSVPVQVSSDPLRAARGILEVYLTPVVGGV